MLILYDTTLLMLCKELFFCMKSNKIERSNKERKKDQDRQIYYILLI